MLIQITKKQTSQVEIPVPCFFKNKDEDTYLGVLDEKTVVRIFKIGDHAIIINTTSDLCPEYIRDAYESFHSCTESEFLTAYDETIESISLHPKLAV